MSDAAARRWRETCELFHELSELDATAQLRLLSKIGESDPDMRNSVETLLAADGRVEEQLKPLALGLSEVLHRNLTESRPPVPDSLRLTGRMLSHFHIIEPIAAGGMGVVYRASDSRLNREVALKLPLVAQQLDSRGRSRFLREAHAAGALDHPNLCSIYEVGETDDGRPFMAMALYAGEPLKSRMTREGRLPLAEVLDIGRQVAAGLAFAHEAGVIHRDIKPGNIMLLPDGSVKILDFGLAKLADLSQTISSAGMGTAGYMAPEQVRGGALDARTDLWALGVLLHEMLTGVRPFRGDDAVSIAHAILHDQPPRPSSLRPEVDRSVDKLVGALLQKEPVLRYARAQDVVADLESIRRGGQPALSPRVPYRPIAWLRTRPRHVQAGIATVAAVLVLGMAAAGWAFGPLERKPTDNADAYRYYLRGRQYELVGPAAAADTLYRRALALDPDFALARARLAIVQLGHSLRPVQANLEQGRREATVALRQQPRLAEAHYAMAIYWQRVENHEKALAEFALARRGLRKTAALHGGMGSSYVGLGRWKEAVVSYERALELDPRDIQYAPSLAITYGRMRRYRESQHTWARYIALTPDSYLPMLIKGYSVIRSDGTADTLAAALKRIPPDWDGNGMATFARFAVARIERRPADALAALAASSHSVSEDAVVFRPHSLLRGIAYEDAGDSARAHVHFDSARAMMQDSIARHPDDPRLHIALGMALAGLERREDAVRAARRAMALAPLSSNVILATCNMGGAAEIFAYLGETDAAIDLLERLLEMPAGREASVPLLRVDPVYDKLRGIPRFERMLARHARSSVAASN